MREHLTNPIGFSQEEKADVKARISAHGPAHVAGCAGIDEAGRGCLAGPVVAACVWLPDAPGKGEAILALSGLTDSKQLGETMREQLEPRIKNVALAWSLGFVWPREIDRINILQASLKAMSAAYASMLARFAKRANSAGISGHFAGLGLPSGLNGILVDGNQTMPEHALHNALSGVGLGVEWALPQHAVVKGDSRVLSIAAASVLAKVARDRFMRAAGRKFPAYGFERHKGYGTKEHLAAIEKYGVCPLHRLSFQGCGPDVEAGLCRCRKGHEGREGCEGKKQAGQRSLLLPT